MQANTKINHYVMYKHVKEKISGTLQEQSGLQEDTIQIIIEEWKSLIKVTKPQFLKTILGIADANNIRPLMEEEWKYLQTEMEQSFNVRITTGILVTGKDQKNRDTTWWTGKKKLQSDNYYLTNYMTYMKRDLPQKVLETINDDTDAIMNNLADPDLESFSRYGMVVGHVQSGKTSNYASLICKAADAGYRFIVVIAGGQNNLRDQTQARLDEVFVGANYRGVGLLPEFKREKMPASLTNAKNDFKIETARAQGTTNFDNMKQPIIVVIKKHTKTLDHLLKWLDIHYKNQVDKPMLVIDDESDYASINTKKEEEPTVINEKIRLLLQKFKKSAYVAYTATPYANIFIDHNAKNEGAGRDIFPSDFIYALEAPSNYFGAEKIFNKDNEKYVVEIPNDEVAYELDDDILYPPNEIPFVIKHKKDYDGELRKLPESLKDAVRLFVINIAIRNLRNQKKHNSMLIHISRFTGVHVKVKKLVASYFEDLKAEIKAYGNLANPYNFSHLKAMKDTFSERLQDIEFDFGTVLKEVCLLVDSIQVVDVHQKAKIPLEYRKDIQSNVIVIGGLSLSRGFTLEGLSVSYFLRTTIYYDTLMQMGRWFGYRIGYEDICRVYLTDDMNKKFGFIIDATNELVSRLNVMREENLTPEDFGLAVQLHPDSLLQVTARNKSKYTEDMYLEMNLDGQIKETRWISNKSDDLDANETLLKETIQALQKGEYEYVATDSHVWKNVDKTIVKRFVENYRLYKNDPLGLKSRMPIEFIKDYIERVNIDWDVVLYNGNSDTIFEADSIQVQRQYRSVTEKHSYYEVANRQLSRAKPESIIMPTVFKKLKSHEMREKLMKPVLFVHALELGDRKNNKIEAVGFSISFPNSKDPFVNNVKVRINSVYKKQLEEAYREEAGEDGDYDDE
ncbi:Z1 domain-containing protein [Bacillus sp. DTU_2020_1000418_1_SI_GHA_SEK_038]|uniref:Z1 domain-containing protein n=1 Tax=Bacillus sp. DTU_2020_1000418_1_SI_GHA_SEK_038 TaxID=3077585 RepID=UPI0028E383FB|nr:Z1 domain-containing protein [Bacillus sp. DTU_2020_1000418_1_SI_GHA_SEK_038]WNS73682.1 Z1 domain-containing protein [Bacillus sp. DTU_2020_1000418_1_SI_GHA_SEK_038]